MFFAYVHARPDGTPFYVGKGSAERVRYKKRHHNLHHMNVVNKHGVENILVFQMECSNEKAALDLERGLISRLRKMGQPLVNLTDGGEVGVNGAVRSPETRRKMSSAKKGNQYNAGRKYSQETCVKKSRSAGGTSVLAVKDCAIIEFDTISDACRTLGLDKGNVCNHINGGARRRGVKGWYFVRIAA